ncbi:unnamed protein product [Notodromas monacha]|uniref:beta-N-acetylhexosaminidase n=1 Tax=Notodromas monacha TaxID=399045 RepID=A0A7R9BY92_9CRUS|nr:unnamed protein product [Notodromas monacha]CAG0923883.1 unnamed protein product [Notodromas monacha]
MNSNGLTDYSQLEGYIIQRHISQILDLGVSHIVWQDPLEKGIEIDIKFPSETIVQVWKWHSTDMGWADWSEYLAYVTGLGHKAILSSCWYLNLISYGEDWIDYYQCDPHNFEGSEEQKSLVLGGETTFWAEYIDETNLHSRIWPRASAVAEKLWSQTTDSVPDARHRLDQHRCNMIKYSYKSFKIPMRGFQAAPVFNGFCPVERVS